MKVADIIIAILFTAIILLSFKAFPAKGDEIIINADGREYRYPLSDDRIIRVEGTLGETTIEIKDMKARITDSPCPNKTCLYTRMGNTICCLPNRVLLTFSESSDGVDTYAY